MGQGVSFRAEGRVVPWKDGGAAKARLLRGSNVKRRSLDLSLVFEHPGTDIQCGREWSQEDRRWLLRGLDPECNGPIWG